MAQPTVFGSKVYKNQLDLQEITVPGIQREDQTQSGVGFGSITAASFDIAFSEETYGSRDSLERDAGLGRREKDSVLMYMWNQTGDEQFKPLHRTRESTDESYVPYGHWGKNDKIDSIKNNPEYLEMYEKYANEAGLVSLQQVEMQLKDESDERHATLQGLLLRSDSSMDKIAGSITGSLGALLDIALLPSLIIPGGQSTLLRRILVQAGAAVINEGAIQYDVNKTKELLGQEYNPMMNTILAGGIASAIPIFGKLWKTLRKGKLKANTPDRLEVDDMVQRAEGDKLADEVEIQRAGELLEGTGTVTGAKIILHTADEVNLTGIHKKYNKGLEVGNAREIASTLSAKLGVKTANKVLREADMASRALNSITLDEIATLKMQKVAGEEVSLAKAGQYIDEVAQAKAKPGLDSNSPKRPADQPLEEIDYDAVKDLDLKDLEIVEQWNPKTAKFEPREGSFKEKMESLDDDIKDLDETLKCYGV